MAASSEDRELKGALAKRATTPKRKKKNSMAKSTGVEFLVKRILVKIKINLPLRKKIYRIRIFLTTYW